MANEIQELLKEIKDERLRLRLSIAIAELRKTKKFGLVFEEHLPELLPIFSAKIRVQARVARRDGKLTETSIVQKIAKGVATLTPEAGGAPQEMPVAELVLVKRFGEAIFPALRHVESVLRGGDAPHHTLIEADNYHALQFLEWLYAGKVHCIYIDPPYNTGARDWKYNNNYVDSADGWRHSKWLAFMQRRLKLAKRLLRRDRSVLIITIDEKEYLHLGLLLEQMFPDARIQMITTVISQKGSARADEFSRCNEFIFFVQFGDAAPTPQQTDMLHDRQIASGDDVEWGRLTRNGANGRRTARPNLFYPIFFNPDGTFHSVGEVLPLSKKRESVVPPRDAIAVFPTAMDGTEMTWALNSDRFVDYVRHRYVRFGALRPDAPQPVRIYYLTEGYVKAAKAGLIELVPGKTTRWIHKESKGMRPLTVWNMSSHNASEGGTNLVKSIVPERRFPFPKSLYAVTDALRFFVMDERNAVIIDFFAGSGTTLHAVNLLNAADGGQRRCILVTNNEVSAEEAETLRSQGVQPGEGDWEEVGICRAVTYPRNQFSITGRRDDGSQLSGEYLTGRFEERTLRRTFRNLDFLSIDTLRHKNAREA